MTRRPTALRVSAFILLAALIGAIFPLYSHLSGPDPVAAQTSPTEIIVSGGTSVSEDVGSVNVKVTLNQPAPAGGVTVTLRGAGEATHGSDPNLGADFTMPAPFTIPAGQRTATASIAILDDLADEPDEYFIVDARTNVAGITNTIYARMTILDNDAPSVTILDPKTLWSATLNVNGNGCNVHNNTSPCNGTLTNASGSFTYEGKSYEVVSVTNLAGQYRPNSNELNVVISPAPPESFKTSKLTFVAGGRKFRIDDSIAFKTWPGNEFGVKERFLIVLAAETIRLWNPGQNVALSLVDDYIYTIKDAEGAEGEDARMTIYLPDKAPQGGLRFSVAHAYVTATSTDVGAIPQTFLVPAGLKSAPLSIPVLRDSEEENDETLTVTITPNDSKWKPAKSGANTATLTITDTTEQVSFLGGTAFDASEATSTQIWLTRSGPTNRPLSVQVKLTAGTADADDYTTDSANQTVTFWQAPYAAYGIFTITPTDDMIDEDDETVTASIIPPAGYSAGPNATITVRDDDTAGVTLSTTTISVQKDARATYKVKLDSKPTASVAITPGGAPGIFTAAARDVSGILTFGPQNWNVEQEVVVTGKAAGSGSISHTVVSEDGKYDGNALDVAQVNVTVNGAAPQREEESDATLSFGSATIADKVYTAGGRVNDPGLPLAQVEGGVVQVDYSATGLPAGLELTPDRAIRGAPAEPTNTPATVTYTASGSNGSSASLTFDVTVMPPVELSETNIATVVYTIGQAKSLNVVLPEASGGEAPLTYHLLRNRIAKRVSPMEIRNGEVKSLSDSAIFGAGAVAFDSSTRAITGAPQRANRAALSYYAIDANGAFAQTTFDMRVVNPPRFETIADKTYAIGETVNEKLPKPAGGAIYSNYSRTQYQLAPLPRGLSFGVSTRKITGTVTAETPARTTVTYTVTDRNGVSASTTFDIIVPGGVVSPTAAPTLAAYTVENRVVALDWEDVEGATGYVVQVKAAADEWPTGGMTSAPAGARVRILESRMNSNDGRPARALVLGLIRGEEYAIRVAAANEAGTGPFSEAVTAALAAPPPLPASPQITASASGNTLNLDWSDVPGATGYIVQVKAADAAWPTEARQSLPPGTFTEKNHKYGRLIVIGLTMGVNYQARMAAVNESGAGEFSTVWNFVLGSSATPLE